MRAAIANALPAPPVLLRGRRGSAVFAALLVAALGLCTGAGAEPREAQPLEAKLELPDGGKLRLSELRGRPVLVELWASWCAPCKDQARILEELHSVLEAGGVTVLAVNVGERSKDVSAYLAEHPKSFPVALDRAQLLPRLLDIAELPVLALLDAEGFVVGSHVGLAERDEVLGLVDSEAIARAAD